MRRTQADLRQVYLAYAGDTAFEALRSTASRPVVPGTGPLHPRVVFVGEAPGEAEDRLGRPFVGPAGEILNDLLRGIGLKRSEVFVTNVVKVRPPDNRDPTGPELEASVPYLTTELRVLAPKVVVSLGRHSTRALWPEAPGIKVCAGMIRHLDDHVHVPSLHPGAKIYDPPSWHRLVLTFYSVKRALES